MIKSEQQTIECPNCKSHEQATVLHTWPWATFIHECEICGYVIMESEWQEVNPEDNDPTRNP